MRGRFGIHGKRADRSADDPPRPHPPNPARAGVCAPFIFLLHTTHTTSLPVSLTRGRAPSAAQARHRRLCMWPCRVAYPIMKESSSCVVYNASPTAGTRSCLLFERLLRNTSETQLDPEGRWQTKDAVAFWGSRPIVSVNQACGRMAKARVLLLSYWARSQWTDTIISCAANSSIALHLHLLHRG